MIWSSMNGTPYLVGRFPHTLRMRLMREHIGIDVDEILEEDIDPEFEVAMDDNSGTHETKASGKAKTKAETASVSSQRPAERDPLEQRQKIQDEFLSRTEDVYSFNHDVDWEQADNPNLKSGRKMTADSRVTRNLEHRKDLEGDGVDRMKVMNEAGYTSGRDTYQASDNGEYIVVSDVINCSETSKLNPPTPRKSVSEQYKRDTDRPSTAGSGPAPAEKDRPQSRGAHSRSVNEEDHVYSHVAFETPAHLHPLSWDIKRPHLDKNCMKDPLDDSFYLDIWQTISENNTKLFRAVFRCMPDNEVKSWKDYKEYNAYAERFADMQNKHYYNANAPPLTPPPRSESRSGPPGAGTAPSTAASAIPRIADAIEKTGHEIKEKVGLTLSNEAVEEDLRKWASEANKAQIERTTAAEVTNMDTRSTSQSKSDEKAALKVTETRSSHSSQNPDTSFVNGESEKSPRPNAVNGDSPGLNPSCSRRKRRRATTRGSRREFHASDDIISMREAEELMNLVQGHLILWPYDW
jgi:phospholipase D1/2